MLEEIRICGLGVIADAVLPLSAGLTVVTGETGAGKTMVVTGLSLLFGDRADPSRVRLGQTEASVDARLVFDGHADARAVYERVADVGGVVEVEDNGSSTLLLRRSVTSGGRSRAYVGGTAAPIGVLAELGESLFVLHGQSDQLRLTRPAQQRALLDRYGKVELAQYREAFQHWQAAVQQLRERSERAQEMQREADLLAHGLAEIEAAAPYRGEESELAARAGKLAHADALRLASFGAHEALRSSGDGPHDVSSLLDVVVRELAAVAGADPVLDALTTRARELAALSEDLAVDLAGYSEDVDADPAQLAEVEQRRSVLAALTRRYGTDIAAVLVWAEQARARLVELDVSEETIATLVAQRDEWEKETARLAAEVTSTRMEAGRRLQKAVSAELTGLAMPGAELVVELTRRVPVATTPTLTVDGIECGAGLDGVDEVLMLLRPGAGSPAVPLQKGASGGELSRVMLALEVCLAGDDEIATMVFDEVDAGVGGRAGIEVGLRLALLARRRQVVVVTHLPQVAAFADSHVVVNKTADETVSASDLQVVQGPERVAELARMLAGRDSATAREHAIEMLDDAAARVSAASGPAAPQQPKKPRRKS